MMYSRGKRFLEFDESPSHKDNFDSFGTTILETPPDENIPIFDHLIQTDSFKNSKISEKWDDNPSSKDLCQNNSNVLTRNGSSSDDTKMQTGENLCQTNNITNQSDFNGTDCSLIPISNHSSSIQNMVTNEFVAKESKNNTQKKPDVCIPLNSDTSLDALKSTPVEAPVFGSNQLRDMNVIFDPINNGEIFMEGETKQKATEISTGSLSNQINGPIDCEITNKYIHTYPPLNITTDSQQIINVSNRSSSHLQQGFTSDESSIKEDGFPVINNCGNFIIGAANEITVAKCLVDHVHGTVDTYESSEVKENSFKDLFCHYGAATPDEQNCCVSKELSPISNEVITTKVTNSDDGCVFKGQTISHSDISKSGKHHFAAENLVQENKCLKHCDNSVGCGDKLNINSTENRQTSNFQNVFCEKESKYVSNDSTETVDFTCKKSDNEKLIIDQDYPIEERNASYQSNDKCLMTKENEYEKTPVNSATGNYIDIVLNGSSKSNNANSSCSLANEIIDATNCSFSAKGQFNSRDRFFQEPLNLDPFIYTVSENCDSDPFGDCPFGEGDPFSVQSPDPFDTNPFGTSDPLSSNNGTYHNASSYGSVTNRPFINLDLSGSFRSVSNNSLYKILEEEEPEEDYYVKSSDQSSSEHSSSTMDSLCGAKSVNFEHNYDSEESNIAVLEETVDLNGENVCQSLIGEFQNVQFDSKSSESNICINGTGKGVNEESYIGDNNCGNMCKSPLERTNGCQESDATLLLQAKALVEYVISQAVLEVKQNPLKCITSSQREHDSMEFNLLKHSTESLIKTHGNQCLNSNRKEQIHCNTSGDKHTDVAIISSNDRDIAINYCGITTSAKECTVNITEEKNNSEVSLINSSITGSSEHERFTQLKTDPSTNRHRERLDSVEGILSIVKPKVSTGFCDNSRCSHDKCDTFNSDATDMELNDMECDNSVVCNYKSDESTNYLENKCESETLKLLAKHIVSNVLTSAIEELQGKSNISSKSKTGLEFITGHNEDSLNNEKLHESGINQEKIMCENSPIIPADPSERHECHVGNIQGNHGTSNTNVIPVAIEIDECSSPESDYGCVPPPQIHILECSTPESSDDNEDTDLIDFNISDNDHNEDISVCVNCDIKTGVNKSQTQKYVGDNVIQQEVPVVFIEHCSSPESEGSSSSDFYSDNDCKSYKKFGSVDENLKDSDAENHKTMAHNDCDLLAAVEKYVEKIIQEAVVKLKEEAMGTETERAVNGSVENTRSEKTIVNNDISPDEDSYSEEIKQLRDQIPEELTKHPESKESVRDKQLSEEEIPTLNNNNTIDLKAHSITQEQSNIQHTYESAISTEGNPITDSDFRNQTDDLQLQENLQETVSNFGGGDNESQKELKRDTGKVESSQNKDENELLLGDSEKTVSDLITTDYDYGDEEISSFAVADHAPYSPSELPAVMDIAGDYPLQRELSLADELSQSMTEEKEDNLIADEQTDTIIDSPRIKDPEKARVGHISHDISVADVNINVANQSAVSESDSLYDRIIDTVLTSTPRKSQSDEPILPPQSKTNSPKRKIIPNLDLLNADDDTLDLPESPSSSSAGYSSPGKTPDGMQTPEYLKKAIFGEESNKSSPAEPIPEYSAEEEYENNRNWRSVQIGDKKCKIDMRVIEPYKKVLSHGGYYGDGFNAIIVFSGCHLPDKRRRDYQYVMDNLFLYVVSTLELLVVEDYMIVYFHGATPKDKMPNLKFLRRCYDMIDRRLRKNLKKLLIIHPTFWLKTVVWMTKPFISSKFYYKMEYVKSLQQLTKLIPCEYVFVPDEVKLADKKSNKVQPKKKFVNM